MKKIILISALLLISSASFAQYKSFKNRNIAIHLTANSSFDYSFSETKKFNGRDYDQYEQSFLRNVLAFHFIRYNLNVEFLKNREKSILTGIGYHRMGFWMSSFGMNKTYNYNLSGIDLVLHKRKYFKNGGGIAPVGWNRFIGTGVSINQLSRIEILEDNPTPEKEALGNLIRPLLFWGIANNRIVTDDVMMTIGFELGAPIPLSGDDFNEDIEQGNAYIRLLQNHLFKIKFGLIFP